MRVNRTDWRTQEKVVLSGGKYTGESAIEHTKQENLKTTDLPHNGQDQKPTEEF